MTIERISRINNLMVKVLKIVYLNFLWAIFSIIGGIIFTIGPATYAMMKYYDRWIRLGEELPVTKSFFHYFKENFLKAMLISWIFVGLFFITIVNIFYSKIWAIRMGNVVLLFLVLFSFTHVYSLMAETVFTKVKDILKRSVLLGFGYLHYSIITWTFIVIVYFLTLKLAPAALFVFGAGFIGYIFEIANKKVIDNIEGGKKN